MIRCGGITDCRKNGQYILSDKMYRFCLRRRLSASLPEEISWHEQVPGVLWIIDMLVAGGKVWDTEAGSIYSPNESKIFSPRRGSKTGE